MLGPARGDSLLLLREALGRQAERFPPFAAKTSARYATLYMLLRASAIVQELSEVSMNHGKDARITRILGELLAWRAL
jgi:hypothetical protein